MLRSLDPNAASLVRACQGRTMVSLERLVAVIDAARYLARAGVEGDVVECGVWRGGCAMALAGALFDAEDRVPRTLWLYDTFAGMTTPGAEDRTVDGHAAADVLARLRPDDPRRACGRDEVHANLLATGWPETRLRLVEGPVEETLPHTRPDRIALLRLDTDWYASTRAELEHLWPRLVPGGVLLVDDYGHWDGCRRAVDEYFEEHAIRMLFARSDYTGRMGVKLAA